jgi:hypothetical protein
MLLDDATTPKIRPRIAEGAENAIELDGLVGLLRKQEFNRIDRNRIRVVEI